MSLNANNISFLQSHQWGKFQESLGRKIWWVEIAGLKGLIIKHDLPLNKNYLYCPRGPIHQGDINQFLDQVKEIGKQEKSIFFKIEPEQELEFKKAKELQPSRTIVLDLNQSEGDLLKQMHAKTRYNIRLAERKGIKVEILSELNSDFFNLLKQTAERDKFYLHEPGYYQKMMDALGKEEMVKLFLAKYQNKTIAANLICFFNQRATYLHGASDYQRRNLMAPYLLQWQAILEAKKQNMQYYDFWGIDEQKWPGVTRFKKGFGGQEIVYPGAYNLVYRPIWHLVYKLAREILLTQ